MSGPFFVPAFTPLAAFRSFLTYVVIVVYIAVIGPPTLLIAWAFGWKRALYLAGHGGVGLALLLTGHPLPRGGARERSLRRGRLLL
jgi:hypothetical protein